jgi:hypothetical protein
MHITAFWLSGSHVSLTRRLQECGHESSRPDKFLDIPLVIRPFGATRAVRSIEEVLWPFFSTTECC